MTANIIKIETNRPNVHCQPCPSKKETEKEREKLNLNATKPQDPTVNLQEIHKTKKIFFITHRDAGCN